VFESYVISDLHYQVYQLNGIQHGVGMFSQITLTNGNDLIAAFTDSSDESAAPSSFSDSASRHNNNNNSNNNNNDWLTDDDDDDEDDVMDESQLNVQPAAKAAAAKTAVKPKVAVVPLSTGKLLACLRVKSISRCFNKCLICCPTVNFSYLFSDQIDDINL